MKVSYLDIVNLSGVNVPVEEMVARIGSRLGEVESVMNLNDKYKDALIVKVVSCEKHPDADKLSVCRIDDGGALEKVDRAEDGYVQVVCGAPNVHADMWAVWLPPGMTVPATISTDEWFVLEARQIRGQVSNGMLASQKELDLGDNHDGILELTGSFKPGDSFAKTYRLDDYIIDIENKMFTHRPDCFGVLGVAREVAGIYGQQFSSPDWYNDLLDDDAVASTDEFRVQIDTPLVSRFSAKVIDGITVEQSPLERQIDLVKVGLRPVNNIVDITNYAMHFYGQPLHAYDYHKLEEYSQSGPVLIARESQKGETLTLINGKKLVLDEPAIVIATDSEVVGLAGIMGGADTEVSETTTKIVLEAAHFDMYAVRKTSMHYGIFSDAVARFNKGQSPHQTLPVLKQAVNLLGVNADLPSYDVRADYPEKPKVEISINNLSKTLGLDLTAEQIAKMLGNVECSVEVIDASKLLVGVPFWRMDIEQPEDILEELGRLYGYDNLPQDLPLRSAEPTEVNGLLTIKKKIREQLSHIGASEVLTYAFVHRDLLVRAGQEPENSYAITNALSPDLHFYRQTLMPSLLDKINSNIRVGYKDFALFEVGKTHNKIHDTDSEGVPDEIELTALVFASSDKSRKQAAYFVARRYLEALCQKLGHQLDYKEVDPATDYPITRPYDLSRSALVHIKNGPFLGIIGEFRSEVEESFKLPRLSAGFEIDTKALLEATPQNPYKPLSKFPHSTQDITLQTTADISHNQLHSHIEQVLAATGYDYSLETVSIFSPQDDLKNTTFSIELGSHEKTLTTDEVSDVISKIAVSTQNSLKARQL